LKRTAPAPAADRTRVICSGLIFPGQSRGALAEPAPTSPQPHRHEGTELIYVIKGRLAVNIDGTDVALDEGDALCFDSGTPHFYRREGRAACAAIIVVSPK
jgi:mannose-6-phosphate isomerase-like protein (cupin superfamily)